MRAHLSKNYLSFLLLVALVAWFVPGGGHYILKRKKHAVIISVTIILTFLTGLYIGSLGVIDSVHAKPWYLSQLMVSPVVSLLGIMSAKGDYTVFGRPLEIGQIYTSIAGMLNLLCIINAVYLAHMKLLKRQENQIV